MNSIKQDIQAVENVIRLLNQCLKINIDTYNNDGIKNCLQDVRTCKKELERLYSIQQSKAAEAKKGALDDALQ